MVLRQSTDAEVATRHAMELRMAQEAVQNSRDAHASELEQRQQTRDSRAQETSSDRDKHCVNFFDSLPGPDWLKRHITQVPQGRVERVSSLGYLMQEDVQVQGLRLWAGTGVPCGDYRGPIPLPLSRRPTSITTHLPPCNFN